MSVDTHPSKAPLLRLIPFVLFWAASIGTALCLLMWLTMTLYTEVENRWIDPNPDLLEHIHEKHVSPPIIAWLLALLVSVAPAFIAGKAWYQCKWSKAIRYSAIYIALACIAKYLSGNL